MNTTTAGIEREYSIVLPLLLSASIGSKLSRSSSTDRAITQTARPLYLARRVGCCLRDDFLFISGGRAHSAHNACSHKRRVCVVKSLFSPPELYIYTTPAQRIHSPSSTSPSSSSSSSWFGYTDRLSLYPYICIYTLSPASTNGLRCTVVVVARATSTARTYRFNLSLQVPIAPVN